MDVTIVLCQAGSLVTCVNPVELTTVELGVVQASTVIMLAVFASIGVMISAVRESVSVHEKRLYGSN